MQDFGQATTQLNEGMSDVEAQEVLRLHLRRAEGAPQLSVQDVAEAIRIPEHEVRQLLDEVRGHKRAEDLLTASPEVRRWKERDTKRAFMAAIIFVALAACYLIIVNRARIFPGRHEEVVIATGPNASSWIGTGAAAESVVASEPGLNVEFLGTTFLVPCNIDSLHVAQSEDLMKVLSSEVENRLATPVNPSEDTSANNKILKELVKGHYDIPGIVHDQLTLRIDGIEVSESMPHHPGAGGELEEFLRQQRRERLKEMLEMIQTKRRLQLGDTSQ